MILDSGFTHLNAQGAHQLDQTTVVAASNKVDSDGGGGMIRIWLSPKLAYFFKKSHFG